MLECRLLNVGLAETMKIGISVRRFGPFGGMEKVAFGFVGWLAKHGHHVDVWTDDFEAVGPTVRHRPLGAGGRGVLWKAQNLACAVRRIPTEDCDVFLHFERGGEGGPYRAGAGCHASLRKRCGGGWAGPFLEAIDRKTCRSARPLIVNSQLVSDEMQDFYGVDSRSIRLVRNGVDTQRFCPSDRFEQPTVVFVGSDARRKGLWTAIHAIALLDQVQLYVLGQVTAMAKWWAHVAGVTERVHFLGWTERPEDIVGRAHAMALPTHYDASANATLEALASGVPVVTTRANGASEVLPVPWLVLDDPRDVEGCAEVLLRAMNDSTLPDACRSVAESYDVESSYSALLQAILEDPC